MNTHTCICAEGKMLLIIHCKMVPKVFIKYCSRFSYLKNLNILKTGISRSIASMTNYHPDVAKVFHEQNVENYLQNWEVKEYAYA
jgi:hypothetical protein